MQKPCGQFNEQLLRDFALGRLNSDQQRDVGEHLAACPACSGYLANLTPPNGRSPATTTRMAGPESYSLHAPAEDALASKSVPFALDILDPANVEGTIGRLSKYDILGVRGAGGMGVVLKGYDRQLQRVVAIKLMANQLALCEKSQRRFEREAILAASINHPNVVTIHGVESHRGIPFIVMEYVEGKSLQQVLAERGRLATSQIIRLTAQIASGLAAAHARGIIHRDIKPGNIMLEDGIERVKITDFGLARIALENSDLTSLGEAIGTPAFMSPEQINGLELTPATDIFSLGSVVHAMVILRSPFSGGHPLRVAQRIASLDLPLLDTIEPGIPPGFARLVARMLEKEPRDRVSAAEIESRLNSELIALNQEQSGMLPPVTPRATRKYWSAALAMAVLAVGIGSAIWSFNAGEDGTAQQELPATKVLDAPLTSAGSAEPVRPGVVPVPVDYQRERQAAKWVLDNRGAVIVKTVSNAQVTARSVNELPHQDFLVQEIDLTGSGTVTDAGLEELRLLCGLLRLQLQETPVSDEGLVAIADLTSLKYLGLGATSISDQGLAHLARLTNLQRLNLQQAPISGSGLKYCVRLDSLDGLYLNQTGLKDDGLQWIARLPRLRRLELNGTAIGADGISQLAKMTKLAELHIADTKIPEASLAKLQALNELKVLDLGGLQVSDETFRLLKQKLPGCNIRR